MIFFGARCALGVVYPERREVPNDAGCKLATKNLPDLGVPWRLKVRLRMKLLLNSLSPSFCATNTFVQLIDSVFKDAP